MSASVDEPSVPKIVVDASVVLAWYLPAEPYKDAALEILEQASVSRTVLCAPTLMRFEVLNVLALSVRGITPRQRLAQDEADEILAAFLRLPLEEHPITALEQRVLEIAVAHRRSAYDAAYLALAEALNAEFVTGDAGLYRTIRRRFPMARLIGPAR